MVTQAYLLHRPPPPSNPKRFLDQQVIPALIDAAAAVEAQIETAANTTRRNPLLACGAMLAIGWLVGGMHGSRRRSLV
jgi:hypothetical protein